MTKFKIPIHEYQAKSKSLMNSIEDTTDDFNGQFLKTIKSMDDIDAKDRSFLEGSSAYTKSFKKYDEIEDEILDNFQKMASDGGDNPMDPLVRKDEEFANRFKELNQANPSPDVDKRIGLIHSTAGVTMNQQMMIAFLKETKKFFNSTEYKQILNLIKAGDFMNAFDRMLECDQFLDALDANPKLADVFIDTACNFCTLQQKINKSWSTGMQKFLNSDGLQALLKKLPEEKSLRLFNAIEKTTPDKILKQANKFLTTMKNIANKNINPIVQKGLKSIQKAGKGFIGRTLGRCIKSPWGGAIFSGLSTTIVDTFKTGDIRKGVGHGVIDGIASIDTIDGIMIGATNGAKIGGFWGAIIVGAIGGGLGFFSQRYQESHPNFVGDLKKKMDRNIDRADEQRNKEIKERIRNIEQVNEEALAWFP